MEDSVESPLQDKNSYIIKSSVPDNSYALLSQKLTEGYDGLCLTRTNPNEVKGRYGLNASMIWLTNQKSDDFFSSSSLSILKTKVKNFIKKNNKSVVLLDRIDYLINVHGFNEVIKLIYSLSDEALVNNAILMLNVNPETLTSHQLSLLEQELKEISGKEANAGSELPDDLEEILIFVNNSDKITFKKVSKEFSITKTTTRKRINKLEEIGLVVVKKNGRNKIVKISEEGKKFV